MTSIGYHLERIRRLLAAAEAAYLAGAGDYAEGLLNGAAEAAHEAVAWMEGERDG